MPIIELPDYALEVTTVKNVDDVPTLTFTTNANFTETAEYINKIKAFVEELDANNSNSGLTENEVRAVITSTRLRREVDGSRHSSIGTVTYNAGTSTEYTVTYSITAEAKHQYVISNPYPTESSFVIAKNSDGVVEYPITQTIGTNVVLTFTNKLDTVTKKYITIF